MKKISILIAFIGLSVLSIKAQNIRLIDLNNVDVTNSTVYDVVDTASLDPYVYHADVINATAAPVSINCERVQNNITAVSESYFCWDQCYSPVVDLAQPLTANAFDTIKGFFGAYFNSYQQVGVNIMKYVFFNTSNVNDTATLTVVLNAGTLGINNIGLSANNKMGTAFPNPAAGYTNIKYAVENSTVSTLKITNELGQVLFSKQLENTRGTLTLNTNEFAPGVYFYSLFVGNANVSTKKLIITE